MQWQWTLPDSQRHAEDDAIVRDLLQQSGHFQRIHPQFGGLLHSASRLGQGKSDLATSLIIFYYGVVVAEGLMFFYLLVLVQIIIDAKRICTCALIHVNMPCGNDTGNMNS